MKRTDKYNTLVRVILDFVSKTIIWKRPYNLVKAFCMTIGLVKIFKDYPFHHTGGFKYTGKCLSSWCLSDNVFKDSTIFVRDVRQDKPVSLDLTLPEEVRLGFVDSQQPHLGLLKAEMAMPALLDN